MLDFDSIFSSANPVFSGGFGLAVIAGGATVLRSGSVVGLAALRRHFLVTLEITSKDKSYPWVLQWLYARGNMTQHISVETSMQMSSRGASNVKIDFVPGPGRHMLNYNGRLMLVQRVREQQMVDLNSGKPWEKIQFTTYGKSTKAFESILSEAFDMCMKQEEGKTIIYTNWGSEWRQFGQPRNKRSINSVILDDKISDNLLTDVNEWMSSSSWYHERGIPYRRGYLLHGPPGSGKSSFIMALAGKLGYNICILNLAERGLTDDRLALALNTIPAQSLVLLEDIDAAFPSREQNSGGMAAEGTGFNNTAANNYSSDVTFSGLLNVLDGVASSEERLIFMTTNYIERLDPALIRPGRVDFVQIIGDATDYQIRELFQRFYPDTDSVLCCQFTSELRKFVPTISMAMLQGYLLRFKSDPLLAIKSLNQLALNSSMEDVTGQKQSSSKATGGQQLSQSRMKGPGGRRLTVSEIDKMYFNPQDGWDKEIKSI